ncbi:hypothetical protein LCGC14_2253760 [marine sediment metagenome]|uniref:Uncharacterized protein n=1 Tax=marine sediment metagenome TaxID=412755 RepID=A0A0F9FWP9_9ZZZZ
MSNPVYEPLPREEVIKAVERKGPARVPMIRTHWWGEGLGDQYGRRLEEFAKYPEDFAEVMIGPLDPGEMGLSWKTQTGGGHDSNARIPDWKHLDEFGQLLLAQLDLGTQRRLTARLLLLLLALGVGDN